MFARRTILSIGYIPCCVVVLMQHNVEHKISAGLKAVSCPAPIKFEKGITVQFGTNTRINFMQCYRQFLLRLWMN